MAAFLFKKIAGEHMIEPTFDRILIRKEEFEQVTDAGIVIATSAKKHGKENVSRGVVVATGTGRTMDSGYFLPVNLKVGDKVLFEEESAFRVTDMGVDYLLMREAQILGVCKPSKKSAGAQE